MNRKAPVALLSMLLATLSLGTPLSYAQDGAKWTFMVYPDADNNLDLAGVNDVVEMQSIDSSAWTYWCCSTGVVNSAVSTVQECSTFMMAGTTHWGGWSDEYELNMGDPETLTWFIDYTVAGFPADKYALILWDHGGNWEGVCWDDTDDDYLTMEEVKAALARSVIDHADLLGFDACLMASIEVAYTMKLPGKVGALVASEDSIPWDGWLYDTVLQKLVDTPSQTEYEFAVEIVERYIASYAHTPLNKVYVTLSAIDCAHLGDLVDDFADLAEALLAHFDAYAGAITGSKNQADRHWFGIWHQGPYIDLHQFVTALGDKNEDLRIYTQPIVEEWNGLVIASKCHEGPHYRGGNGLTTYFPRNRTSFYAAEPYYESLSEFAEETSWHALLTAYFGS